MILLNKYYHFVFNRLFWGFIHAWAGHGPISIVERMRWFFRFEEFFLKIILDKLSFRPSYLCLLHRNNKLFSTNNKERIEISIHSKVIDLNTIDDVKITNFLKFMFFFILLFSEYKANIDTKVRPKSIAWNWFILEITRLFKKYGVFCSNLTKNWTERPIFHG